MLRRPLIRCGEKAGLTKHVTPQTLRRTVNNLIRQAAGEIAARAITGHATQAMTEHYSDVTAAEKHRAGRAAFGDIIEIASVPKEPTPVVASRTPDATPSSSEEPAADAPNDGQDSSAVPGCCTSDESPADWFEKEWFEN